jgi:hypothetical protein
MCKVLSIFETKRKVIGGWRILRNEKLYNLNTSPYIIIVMRRRIRWAGNIARMEKMRNAYKISVERNLKERF